MDGAVSDFITEEVFAYFADEISIDKRIECIQNRASIQISEQLQFFCKILTESYV